MSTRHFWYNEWHLGNQSPTPTCCSQLKAKTIYWSLWTYELFTSYWYKKSTWFKSSKLETWCSVATHLKASRTLHCCYNLHSCTRNQWCQVHGNRYPHYRPFTMLRCCTCHVDLPMPFLRLQLRQKKQGRRKTEAELQSKATWINLVKFALNKARFKHPAWVQFLSLPTSIESRDCSSSSKPGCSSLSGYGQRSKELPPQDYHTVCMPYGHWS